MSLERNINLDISTAAQKLLKAAKTPVTELKEMYLLEALRFTARALDKTIPARTITREELT